MPRFDAEGIISCEGVGDLARWRFRALRRRGAGAPAARRRQGHLHHPVSDETGVCNVVVWERMFEHFRKEVMGARLLLVEGKVQKSPEGVVHLMAERLIDRSDDLHLLSGDALSPAAPTHRHPRNVRVLPPSRDFH